MVEKRKVKVNLDELSAAFEIQTCKDASEVNDE